jgi:putative transposase
VTAVSEQEHDGALLLFARLNGGCKKLRRLWIDGGYRSSPVSWVAAHFRFVLEPVLVVNLRRHHDLVGARRFGKRLEPAAHRLR